MKLRFYLTNPIVIAAACEFVIIVAIIVLVLNRS
jgi:hypothetical protein